MIHVGRVSEIVRYPVKSMGVLKAVARLNQNHAGVYATVVRNGTIRVRDRVSLL